MPAETVVGLSEATVAGFPRGHRKSVSTMLTYASQVIASSTVVCGEKLKMPFAGDIAEQQSAK